MKIIKSIEQMKLLRKTYQNKTIGFVPTMGALHAGHLSLCTKSQQENNITIVSIFVNPTQFNSAQDYDNYPNTLNSDISKLEELNIDYLFLPEYKEIYADNYNYQVHEHKISTIMEGKHRPGHFNGVLTIVLKLNNIVTPNHLYLGQKDYQQAMLIENMFKALFIDTKVIICPTIRDEHGLALSSRNALLSPEQLELSRKFNKLLSSSKDIESIIKELELDSIQVEYIEEYDNRRHGAIKLGDVRLIDNVKI